MSNGGDSGRGSSKKRKKNPPIRSVVAPQDNTRVSLRKVKEPNVRTRYLNAIEGGVKHLKKQLNRLEKNEETPPGPLKYKKNMTSEERVKIGKRMEELSNKRKRK